MIQNMINYGLNGLEINFIVMLVFSFFLLPINLVLQYFFLLVILTSLYYFRMEAGLPALETNQQPKLPLQQTSPSHQP